MLIISSRGEMKVQPADISVIGTPGTKEGLFGAKRTISVAATRTHGQIAGLVWDTTVYDNGGFIRTSTARIYAPQTGWYMANFYIRTNAASPHMSVVQIQSSRLLAPFCNRKRKLGGSAAIPCANSVTGKVYLYKDDSIYIYWGTWNNAATITSYTGEVNVGFSIWKTS